MSKSLLAVLLVALMGVAVHATHPHHVPDFSDVPDHYYNFNDVCPNAKAMCRTAVGLKFRITGPGACSGRASAFCSAFAKSTGKCFDQKRIYSVYPDCRHIDIRADVRCYAEAVAQAFTEASSVANCNGKFSYGCTAGYAEAHAIACALAQVLIDMNIQIGHNVNACQADIVVAIQAIAEAVAYSNSKSCSVNQGLVVNSDQDFGYAIQDALATAFATCWQYCDGGIGGGQVNGGGSATNPTDNSNQQGDGSSSNTGGGPVQSLPPFPSLDLDPTPGSIPTGIPVFDDSPGSGPISSGSTDNSLTDLPGFDENGKPIFVSGTGGGGFFKRFGP